MVGNALSLVDKAPYTGQCWRHTSKGAYCLLLDFPSTGILKTQQPSVMTPRKETSSRLSYN